MRRRYLTTDAGSRRGQALMVAVLLMMAILLVGILFVALVTYNQTQSARHEDNLLAQAMAEAGVRYAAYMLENSPEGADWRPPEPPATDPAGAADPDVYGPDQTPGTEDDYYDDTALARGWAPVVNDLTTRDSYTRRGFSRFPDTRHPAGVTTATMPNTVGRGYFYLRVTYDPWEPGDTTTPDPMNWHIKIESIGRVEGTSVFRTLVAYKPIPMLNYARFVHNTTNHGRPAFFGTPPWADMDVDGTLRADPADPRSDWLATTIDGPVKVNGPLHVAGGIWPDGSGGVAEASTTFALTDGFSTAGYLRRDKIEAVGGIYRWQEPADTLDDTNDRPAQVVINADPPELMTYTSDDVDPDPDSFDTIGGHVLDGQQGLSGDRSRFVSWTNAGSLTLGEGVTNFERYKRLTRDSGDVVSDAGTFVNNGQWGYGRGIYIDNFTDIQFNHDIQALIDDWQRPTGSTGTPPPDSGWNALFTTYAPPAVEIEFLPTEAAAGNFETSLDPREVTGDEVWWPYHDDPRDIPGIRITRHDRTWRVPENIPGGPNAGDDSGQRTIVVDYPTPWLDGTDDIVRHPLIVAEGNVRVSGQLPPAMNTAGDVTRAYDMIVVSGGTIYIDGQLLAPNDYLTTAVPDAFNTRVALLARDCVCLNATRIVPQDTFGTAPAVPDDPLNPADPNKHWELAPGSDGRGYSMFYWGDEPVGASAALVVRQAAADPGPSGVSLTMWDELTADYTAYDFVDGDPSTPTLAPPMNDTTFTLVPPATVYPDGSNPPQLWGVAAIAPDWAPYREAAAGLPWDLAGLIDPTPGLKNALVLRHSDPNIGAGSTSYWLKRWKIAEYNDDGLPVGAINARVNAAVFAEHGCWYVLTPGYFDPELDARDPETTVADVIENRRYNYRVTFIGTIAENFTASVEAARDWTDKLAHPAEYDGSGNLDRWGTIEYVFDDTLRLVRFHSTVTDPTHPAANQPRLPLLPVSPDLVYYGD